MALNLGRNNVSNLNSTVYNTDMFKVFEALNGLEQQRYSLAGLTVTPETSSVTTLNVTDTGTLSLLSVDSANQIVYVGAGRTTDLSVSGTISSGALTLPNSGSGLMPVGSVTAFGSSVAPTGWLICDGSAVSRTTYANLFSIIGIVFGSGDTTTTFNLPDMRGIFPKGAGTTNRTAGKDANGNFYAGTLGTYLQDKMQGHWHYALANTTGSGFDGNLHYINTVHFYPSTQETGTKTVQAAISDGTNGTPRTGLTTEPQSLGLTYIIKY